MPNKENDMNFSPQPAKKEPDEHEKETRTIAAPEPGKSWKKCPYKFNSEGELGECEEYNCMSFGNFAALGLPDALFSVLPLSKDEHNNIWGCKRVVADMCSAMHMINLFRHIGM